MDVRSVFNDFYILLSGKKQTGLMELMKKHKENPLFFFTAGQFRCSAGWEGHGCHAGSLWIL